MSSSATVAQSETSKSVEEGDEGDEVETDTVDSDETEVAVARPPLGTSHSVDIVVSGQAALDTLDELQMSGLIGREKASNLRRKYLVLKGTLESSREAETTLLAQAKQLGQVVHQQSMVLEKGDSFPEGDSRESSRLRKILLNHTNQLEQSHHRQTALDNDLNSVEEEHVQISRELERLPRQSDMDSKLTELNREMEDIRDEIRKRNKDIDRYSIDLSVREQRITSVLKETEELRSSEESLQNELMQLRSAPGNLPREIDTLIKRYRDSKQQVTESNTHLSKLVDHLEELQANSEDREREVREEGTRLVEVRGEGGRLNDMHRQAENSLAQAKERQVDLLEQQAFMELSLRHKNTDFSRLYQTLASVAKENESIAKQVKRAELCAEAVRQSEAQLLLRLETLENKIREGEMAATERQQKHKETSEEAENLRKSLSMQEGVSVAQRAMLEGKQDEEEKVRVKMTSISSKLQQLTKEVVALTKQKDKDSRTCHQTKVSELGMKASLNTKDSQLREEKKTVSALQKQFADSAKAYKLIKTERNYVHSQIHRLQQLSSEMKEKWRILENEVEVLTATALEKNRLLQRCGLVHSTKSVELESQRQTGSKLSLDTAQTRAELETQRESLAKLTQNVSSLERQLQQMRRNYEHALQERNDSGLQLIERNEEVCVFHERLNMQEAVLRQANLDLMSREEEIRYLQLEVTQLKRQIVVSRKILPEQCTTQLALDSAQKQLTACEEELISLEQQMENAQDPSRVRLLGGPQTSQEQLLEQLECLERRLAKREQTGLEKELLYEQVCKIVDRLKTRTSAHEQSTLQVAQKVGHYQTKIRDTTRKTMALVSELTMQQANVLRLRQEVSEKETAIERAYTRLEAGQPPDSATELQWHKFMREEQTKRLCEVEEQEETKAEPRPNAYLPSTDGELPIPKPYGSHAPFKPSPAGANMRHIRKPQPKPIDI